MALKKNLPTQYGVDATYWKNTSIAFDFNSKTATSTCSGYASEDTKNSGSMNIDADTVVAKFISSQSEIDLLAPAKSPNLLIFEEKEKSQELSEDETQEKERYTTLYNDQTKHFYNTNNFIIINKELLTAFAIMQKYAYVMHKQGSKLKDAEDC